MGSRRVPKSFPKGEAFNLSLNGWEGFERWRSFLGRVCRALKSESHVKDKERFSRVG